MEPTTVQVSPETAFLPGFDIGSRTLPTRFCLAPLAGYTQVAFRRAIRELGGLGLATTDLVNARLLLEGARASLELIATHPMDQPLSVQIFGGDPEHMINAAKWLEDRGYGGVDINLGCPMRKIGGQGGGARAACDVRSTTELIEQVVNAVRIPVTAKMRLGWDRDQLTAPLLARELELVGVSAITIHGRTRQQGFGGTVDLAGIRAVVEAVQQIPVIGNGDVRCVADAERMRIETGCAAVAIGRGAMLDPWIFGRLDRASRGLDATFVPTAREQVDFLRRHFELMLEQHGDRACVLFRKFAGWYGARLGIPEDVEHQLRQLSSPTDFLRLSEEIEARHGQRQSDVATALLRLPNGPVDHW